MNRPICVLAVIYIIVIIGLHYGGVVFLEYNKVYDKMNKQTGEKFQAIVIDKKQEKEYKSVYIVELISNDKLIDQKTFILNVKKNKNEKNINKKAVLKYGDKIEFIGEYIEPSSARNYGGYDYSLYLKTQEIYGSIEANDFKIVSRDNGNKIIKSIYEFKVKVKEILRKYLNKDEAELCIGLVIGDRTSLSEEIQNDFKDSNLTHMLAVSGSHFTYIILAITYINKIIKRKILGKVITIISIILFMNLTGNTASVVRSGIMAIIIVVSSFLHKKSDIWTSMGIAILIQLFKNPYIIFDIGLQLSYGGVIGIVLFNKDVFYLLERVNKTIKSIIIVKSKKKEKQKKNLNNYIDRIIKYINEAVSVTISANIIIIPIMLLHFNTLSCSFVISNLLAGPLLGIIVIFAFIVIFSCFMLGDVLKPFFYILDIMLKILIEIAHITSNLPLSKMYLPTPNVVLLFLIYINIFLIKYIAEKNNRKIEKMQSDKKINKEILKYSKVKKYLIISITLILVLNYIYPIMNSKKQELEINFIDVGQGDSTLIRVNKKSILVDGGGSMYSDSFDVGEKTLFPYLLDRGITTLDYVIVSHFDADHSQGLNYVLENLRVKNVIVSNLGQASREYDEFMNLAKKKDCNIYHVKKGDILKISDAVIEILYPDNEMINDNVKNNNAIVFKLIWNDISVLFTGDIEEIAEYKILNMYENNVDKLTSTILKVGHHGSKTSSTRKFLEVVKPKIALIGVGKDNNFGHPNSGVIERLKDINCKIYRTDESGEITIKAKLNNKAKSSTIKIDTMI